MKMGTSLGLRSFSRCVERTSERYSRGNRVPSALLNLGLVLDNIPTVDREDFWNSVRKYLRYLT